MPFHQLGTVLVVVVVIVGLLVAIVQHVCWVYSLSHQEGCECWSRFLLPGNPCHWRGERAFRWPCRLVRMPCPPYVLTLDSLRPRCCTHHNMMIDPAILCKSLLRSTAYVYEHISSCCPLPAHSPVGSSGSCALTRRVLIWNWLAVGRSQYCARFCASTTACL